MLFICLIVFFVLSYYVSLRSEFRIVMSVMISAYKRCSVHLCLQLFVGGHIFYLRYNFCLFAYSGVVFCFVFLRLVYPMLPVSLDCPFLIAPSVFSNVYWYIPSVTGTTFFCLTFPSPASASHSISTVYSG